LTQSIAYVEIRLSAHATEDLEKVKKAVSKFFPEELAEGVTLREEPLKGHYGNPITLLEARIEDEGLVEAFLERLRLRLDEDDKQRILRDLDRFLEKNDLYLRFDKQAAFEDEFRIRQDDPIHIRIHFKKGKENLAELSRRLGLTL
jgi:hypothetical protein